MNLQPQSKFLKLDEEGNSALASKIVSNSSIVITQYIENEDTCDFVQRLLQILQNFYICTTTEVQIYFGKN